MVAYQPTSLRAVRLQALVPQNNQVVLEKDEMHKNEVCSQPTCTHQHMPPHCIYVFVTVKALNKLLNCSCTKIAVDYKDGYIRWFLFHTLLITLDRFTTPRTSEIYEN